MFSKKKLPLFSVSTAVEFGVTFIQCETLPVNRKAKIDLA